MPWIAITHHCISVKQTRYKYTCDIAETTVTLELIQYTTGNVKRERHTLKELCMQYGGQASLELNRCLLKQSVVYCVTSFMTHTYSTSESLGVMWPFLQSRGSSLQVWNRAFLSDTGCSHDAVVWAHPVFLRHTGSRQEAHSMERVSAQCCCIQYIVIEVFDCNCNDLELGRFKVIQGQRSWSQWKAHWWFPIWPPLCPTSYLAPYSSYLMPKSCELE